MTIVDPPDPVMPLAAERRGGQHSRPRLFGSQRLRIAGVAIDLVAIALAWAAALALVGRPSDAGQATAALGAALAVHWIAFEKMGLYRSRITAIRLEEMTRVLRGVVASSVTLYLIGRLTSLWVPPLATAVATVATLGLVFAGRSVLRAWLLGQRAAGRFCRSVVIVGANDEAAAMYDILSQHPELGYDVVGIYGDEAEANRLGLGELWRGDVHSASWHVHADKITGAIVAASALDGPSLNRITRELLAVGAHVQLSSRLAGFASRRLQAQSIAYEPVIYLERLELARWQTAVKRTLDLMIAAIALLPASLVIVVFALLVKLEDRGPAIFRQARIGRGGQPFQVLKLRTMVVDAEARLAKLQSESNERSGPLFKMERDPRFTRVGRFMDLTSINELPQLWNVIRGDMSIVGPRPALAAEFADFDTALQTRAVVRPGITGLWQVEARDNPSFDAYRRFDLHYVENWSVSLDIVILVATAESVLSRLLRMARGVPAVPAGSAIRNPPRVLPKDETAPTDSAASDATRSPRRRESDRSATA